MIGPPSSQTIGAVAGNDLLIGERENAIACGDYILCELGGNGADDGSPVWPVLQMNGPILHRLAWAGLRGSAAACDQWDDDGVAGAHAAQVEIRVVLPEQPHRDLVTNLGEFPQ